MKLRKIKNKRGDTSFVVVVVIISIMFLAVAGYLIYHYLYKTPTRIWNNAPEVARITAIANCKSSCLSAPLTTLWTFCCQQMDLQTGELYCYDPPLLTAVQTDTTIFPLKNDDGSFKMCTQPKETLCAAYADCKTGASSAISGCSKNNIAACTNALDECLNAYSGTWFEASSQCISSKKEQTLSKSGNGICCVPI